MRSGVAVGKRVVAIIPLLLIASALVFAATYIVPGDPAQIAAGPEATEGDLARVRTELGLDENPVQRYVGWLGDALRGDLGRSYASDRPVVDLIRERLPQTLSLAFGALLLALLVGTAVGVFAALHRGTLVDKGLIATTSLGVATPSYWLAIILVTLFAVQRRWFPVTGFVSFGEDPVQWAKHLVLPWIALGALSTADIARQTRGSLAGVLDLDYIRTARMKGLSRRVVVYKHALKNAAVPVTAAVGLHVISLLNGAIFVETIFGIQGIGTLAVNGVAERDIPIVQGVALFAALVVVTVNLLADMFLLYVNPRLRTA